MPEQTGTPTILTQQDYAGGASWSIPGQQYLAEASSVGYEPSGMYFFDEIDATGFNFSIPAGSIIDGFKLTLLGYGNLDGFPQTTPYMLNVPGVTIGDQQYRQTKLWFGHFPPFDSPSEIRIGTTPGNDWPDYPTDFNPGNPPTPAQVNSPNFGLALTTWAQSQFGGISLALAGIWVTVYYTTTTPVEIDVSTTVSVVRPTTIGQSDVATSVAVLKDNSTDVLTTVAVRLGVDLLTPTAGQSFTNAAFRIEWSTKPGGQTDFRVVISSALTGSPVVYDTGVINTPDMFYDMPAGVLPSPATLYVKVYVGIGAVNGQSDGWRQFSTNFASAQNVTGVTLKTFDCWIDPSDLPYVLVRWNKVSVTGVETFLQYDIRRRVSGSGDAFIRVGIVEDDDILQYQDFSAAPGVTYDYAVVYEAQAGAAVLISVNQTPSPFAMLQFDHVFLHEPATKTFLRLDTDDVSVDVRDEVVFNQPWGQSSPNAYFGEQNAHEIDVTLDTQVLTNQRIWTTLAELRRLQREEGATLCLRIGRAKERYFVTLLAPSKQQSRWEYETKLKFQETHYVEAI